MDSMIRELSRGNPNYLPSKFWQTLNQKNLEQLESEGIENFKQTVAQNYFLRQAKVQVSFFEAMYAIPGPTSA